MKAKRKREQQEEAVWQFGEDKAVGLAFCIGVLNAVAQWELTTKLGMVETVHGALTFLALWFLVALAQIFTHAFMMPVTAAIMAWQDTTGGKS